MLNTRIEDVFFDYLGVWILILVCVGVGAVGTLGLQRIIAAGCQ